MKFIFPSNRSTIFIILVSCLLYFNTYAQNTEQINSQSVAPDLEFEKMLQLDNSYKDQFDVSGITTRNGKRYVIADDRWNNFIYEIKFDSTQFKIVKQIKLGLIEPLDLEGITYAYGKFFILNEIGQTVYSIDPETTELNRIRINFRDAKINPVIWKTNAGLSGIAINEKDSIMYLAKNREPRIIFEVDLRTRKVISTFSLDENFGNDYGDLVFLDGYLYILEQYGHVISKVDPKTKELINRFSFRKELQSSKGYLYDDYIYGMAQGLEITKDKIVITLDNGGKKVSTYGQRLGLKPGNKPVILFYKRPKDF